MSIIAGSPDHFALRLRKWRLSTKQTVVISYGISALLGCVALSMMFLGSLEAVLIIAILLTVAFLTGYFLKKIDMTL
jgi:hypothetical protein